MERRSSALENLTRRRRRTRQVGIVIALLTVGLFLSVHWWQQRVPPPKAGTGTVWSSVVSSAGGYSVSLPGMPRIEDRELKFLSHSVALHLAQSSPGDITYLTAYCDYPPSARAALSPQELLSATRQTYEIVPGGRIVDDHPITYQDLPGRERRLEGGSGQTTTRAIEQVYLAGTRAYHLATVGQVPFDQLATESGKLFGTFRLAGEPPAPVPIPVPAHDQ